MEKGVSIPAGTPSLFVRANLGLNSTSVVSGIALALIIATGDSTYIATITHKLSEKAPKSAFEKGVIQVSFLLICAMLIMLPIVIVAQGLGGQGWVNALQFGLSVGIGLIPEMLPLVVNANLGKGAISLTKRKVVVKQLAAVQNMGAMSVLCTDKTGTLTDDNISLYRAVGADGKDSHEPLELGFLNSHFQKGMRNVLDMAIVAAFEAGIAVERRDRLAQYVFIEEIPFDFERRRVSVIISSPEKDLGKYSLICKGALEEVLSCCTSYIRPDGSVAQIDAEAKEALLNLTMDFNHHGLRLLAVAHRAIYPQSDYSGVDEAELVLDGLLCFLDPPKESCKQALVKLDVQKVAVKVLTGDSLEVSRKVCSDVGISTKNCVTGPELAAMSDEKFSECIERCTVMAKLTPIQKYLIVAKLKHNGHVVGFLGDGVNDALALREADVGISVDTASDVAKDVCNIILLEKSLLILSHAVRKGRVVQGNTIKYIKMAISSNFGNVLSVVISSFWLPGFPPMTPIMILTNNLLYDISQSMIPFDQMDADYLLAPRPWDIRDLLKVGTIL